MQMPTRALIGRALAGLLAVATVTTGAVAAEAKRPSILFIFTDDQPQICMGCMGNKLIQTPNMDRLAADGVLFTNAFVTTAICCSNRACILTGQHMRRHAVRDFQTPLSAEAFAQTYPALLRKAGYRTGYMGKFAVGWPRPEIRHLSLPADQFDFWLGFPQTINFRQEVDGKVWYLTTLMEEKAVEFLRTNPPNRPFCLTVAPKEPHGPWNYYDPEVRDDIDDGAPLNQEWDGVLSYENPRFCTRSTWPRVVQTLYANRGGAVGLGRPCPICARVASSAAFH